ncbi:MAG TPA: DUF5666 domain-containing protein [Gammaproteobacteria bacterium]|nr:DUF5666 domain-containing protein [Gammaproteobacteria bacterium]
MKRRPLIKILVLLAMVTGLLSCGGGGGGVVAGIGGTGVTSNGTITGFGSIFVNGVEYGISAATVQTNDVPGTPSDLKLGMVVKVSGTVNSDGRTGTANTVTYDANLKGPVAHVQRTTSTTGTFTVLGKTVAFDSTTTTYGGTAFNTLSAAAPADVVQVSGFQDAAGVLHATRIDKTGSFQTDKRFEAKGVVSNYNNAGSAGGTFDLDMKTATLSVTIGSATVVPGGFANGDYVEIRGTLASPSATAVTADAIQIESATLGTDLPNASVEGIVDCGTTPATSAGAACPDQRLFSISGQKVDASGATLEPAALVLRQGSRAEAEGPISAGVLKAAKVEGRSGEIEIAAPVASVDPAGGTLALSLDGSPITVSVTSRTQLEDERSAVSPFTLNDVFAGDFLRVEGLSDGAGGVTATHLKRVSAPSPMEATVTAPVESFTTTSVKVLGVSYGVSATTTLSPADLLSAPALHTGDRVQIVDQGNDGLAESVTLDN